MKKIAAFMMAALLFVVSAFTIHQIAGKRLETNNGSFGMWINSKKDLSYSALAANLHKDTFLMMGSSEFQHGKDTPYHPTAVFGKAGMSVMCVGAAKNQCFSHAIAMAALAPELETKKAVLILSPTWFSAEGIDGSGFAARFSESQYKAVLKNDSLSPELKKQIVKRTDDLLTVSPAMRDKALRDVKILEGDLHSSESERFGGKPNLEDRISYGINGFLAQEKERIGVGAMWKLSGGKSYDKYEPEKGGAEPDWKALSLKADEEFDKECTNSFAMKDRLFNTRIKPVLEKRKGVDKKRSFETSPEYDDLRLFLDVCRDQEVEVMLVLLPINGYWYDYTGFPEDERNIVAEKVEALAEEYEVKLCDFFDEGYNKGWLEDNTHPAGKGWVEINEEAYDFFNENKELHG